MDERRLARSWLASGATLLTPVLESARGPVQAVPVGFVCAWIAAFGLVSSWITPHSARMWYDPELSYLLASLSWFRGQGYVFVDHPGTPVEVLGTLLLGLTYPILHAANEGFISHYLNHPQDFFNVAQTFLTTASIIVAFLVARWSVRVTNWTGTIVGAAIAAVYFIVLPQHSLRVLSSWTHESFNFPAGTLLSLAIVATVRRLDNVSWRSVVALGFASGLLTTIQLYFAAWVVGTAVAVGIAMRLRGATSWQAVAYMLAAGATAVTGFLVGTLPIHDQYHMFLRWVALVVSHRGTYGAGEAGAPNPTEMYSNLVALANMDKLLFAACGVGVILLGWRLWLTRRTRSAHPVLWAAGIGLVCQLLVLLLMNAKHPGFGDNYLVPVAATFPMLVAAGLDEFESWPKVTQLLLAGVALTVLVNFGATMRSAVVEYPAESEWLRSIDAATENMLAHVAKDQLLPRESLRILWTYGTGSPCYALWSGDEFTAGHTFHSDIAQICPRDGYLVLGSDLTQYHDWDVAVLTDGFVAQLYPITRPPGSRAYNSSIDTVRGIGKLVFVTPS